MKRNLFIIFVTVLFILVLLFFYDEREEVLNKQYLDKNLHINIEYPFFNNLNIDTYINQYLNYYMDGDYDYLMIDYDYEKKDSYIFLTMYIYQEANQLVRKIEKSFDVYPLDGIIRVNKHSKKNVDYDIFSYHEINRNQPMIALTFDDGPNYHTGEVLDILEKYHIKATFFVLGCNISGHENFIRRMNQLGMEIGNHMYSHQLLTKLNDKQIMNELNMVDSSIYRIIGKKPTLIRPSYGMFPHRLKKMLDRPIIIWSIDTLDWKNHQSKKIYQHVIQHVHDGDIILMHDIYRATANSLEMIIPHLLKKGYQFVTVSELLYYKEYDLKSGMVYSRA